MKIALVKIAAREAAIRGRYEALRDVAKITKIPFNPCKCAIEWHAFHRA
jgi:hypothetical protein